MVRKKPISARGIKVNQRGRLKFSSDLNQTLKILRALDKGKKVVIKKVETK